MGPSGSGKTSLLTVLGGRSAMKYKGDGKCCNVESTAVDGGKLDRVTVACFSRHLGED